MKNWLLVFILLPTAVLATVKSITSTGGPMYKVVIEDVEISEHTKDYKAIEKALLQPCNKAECTFYVRQSLELRIVVKGEINTPKLHVSWDIPTTRTDGSPLSIDDILRYELEVNGVIHEVNANSTSWSSGSIEAGVYDLRIRTIAVGGPSAFTPMIQVTL